MLALALALSTLLAAPPAASGAPTDQVPTDRVRYQRQSTSAPRVRADVLERRLEQAKRTWAREATETFSDLRDQFAVCRSCVEPELRLKQIAFLINLVETTPEDDPEYPDYLFRLADHYLEMKKHYERQAVTLEDKIDDLEFELEMEAFESEAPPEPED
jgi:hypothetical protein